MKINRVDLLQDLENVLPGVAGKDEIEQTDCFIFKDKKLFAYNGELAICHNTNLDLVMAIKAREFHQLISKIPEEEIDIELKENKINIGYGKGKKSWMAVQEEITLPLDEIQIPSKWVRLPDNFISGVDNCLFSVSRNMDLELFTNLHCKKQFIESCDMGRTSRYFFEEYEFKKEFLLPFKAAQELKKYKPKKYNIATGWLYFKTEDETVLSIRTMEGGYKNLDAVFEHEGKPFKFPSNIVETINRSEIFSKAEEEAPEEARINIVLSKEGLKVEGKSILGGNEENIETKYKGSPIEFSIHPQYLKEIIKKVNKTKIVRKENRYGMLIFETDNFIHAIDLISGEDALIFE